MPVKSAPDQARNRARAQARDDPRTCGDAPAGARRRTPSPVVTNRFIASPDLRARATIRRMRPRHLHRHALAALAVALLATACSADPGVDPSSADWPEAVTPAEAEGEFWVVWTAVAETAEDPTLGTEVERLADLGYDVEPWDPSCQTGAADVLAGLTGYAEPAAVGVAFASEEDAGVFDTRDEGATVSLTGGTWTC